MCSNLRLHVLDTVCRLLITYNPTTGAMSLNLRISICILKQTLSSVCRATMMFLYKDSFVKKLRNVTETKYETYLISWDSLLLLLLWCSTTNSVTLATRQADSQTVQETPLNWLTNKRQIGFVTVRVCVFSLSDVNSLVVLEPHNLIHIVCGRILPVKFLWTVTMDWMLSYTSVYFNTLELNVCQSQTDTPIVPKTKGA